MKLAPEEIEIRDRKMLWQRLKSIDIPAEEFSGEAIDSRTDYTIDIVANICRKISNWQTVTQVR